LSPLRPNIGRSSEATVRALSDSCPLSRANRSVWRQCLCPCPVPPSSCGCPSCATESLWLSQWGATVFFMAEISPLFPFPEPSVSDAFSRAVEADVDEQPDAGVAADTAPLPIKVIRSTRRKKSSAARIVNGTIEVRVPSWMDSEQEASAVADLVRRIERSRKVHAGADVLQRRARALSNTYNLPEASEIKWVTNQTTRWGSCTIGTGVIRISSRLTQVPGWVLDYVVLHELTHLVEPGHDAAFHALMDRYPRSDRAEGFLEAMTLGCADQTFLTP